MANDAPKMKENDNSYQCNKGLNNGAARTNKLASLEAVQVRSCNLTAQ